MMGSTAKAASELTALFEKEMLSVMDDYGVKLAEVPSRCRMVRVIGMPVETLYVDNVPVLELHDIETVMDRRAESYFLTVTRKFRRLDRAAVTVSAEVKP
jgi:hypothetical protein